MSDTEETRWRFFSILARVEFACAGCLLSLMLIFAPYANIQLAGRAASLGLLATGLVLFAVLVSRPWSTLGDQLARQLENTGPLRLLVIGMAIQFTCAWLTSPAPVSDMKAYLGLAAKLAQGERYVDSQGFLAFLPPGLPFALTPFVALFGPGLPAVTVANAVFFAVGGWGIWSITIRLLGSAAARLAVLFYCLWPSRWFSAGLASKENLTFAMMVAGIAFALAAVDARTRKPKSAAFFSGAAFGLATLAQPGLQLFLLAAPLFLRHSIARLGLRTFVARLAIIFIGSLLVTIPWQLRNCKVFDGNFCGVATNGGSVFYRANNPKATGSWIPVGEVPLGHLSELEQNRVGFQLGKQWIHENPAQMLRLSARKLIFLLGSDDYGAYWGIFRGTGLSDEQSARNNLPLRVAMYETGYFVSLSYWIVIAALGLRALWEHRATLSVAGQAWLPLVYPLLYCGAVFAVFESGSRQHIVAVGPLLVLAAAGAINNSRARSGGMNEAQWSLPNRWKAVVANRVRTEK